MNYHHHPRRGYSIIKKAALLAPAFFLSALSVATAQSSTNRVTGTAYGTDYAEWAQAASIESRQNGPGDIDIRYPGTTNVTLSHQVEGSIYATASFAQLTINGTDGGLSNSSEAVMFFLNGTNLTINGGSYSGIARLEGTPLPPIPGRPPQTNYVSVAAMGVLITNTAHVHITDASFSAEAQTQQESDSLGLPAMEVYSSSLVIAGTNQTTFTGGTGWDTNSSGSEDAQSLGGNGLYADNTSVVISNGIFKGGAGGKVTASGTGDALSVGANAVSIANKTDLTIIDGSFTGGDAGDATSEAGSSLSIGGFGLAMRDSAATIHGGTYKGGSEAAAIGLFDSDLTVFGGDFSTGGIYSETLTATTNTLNLQAGSYEKLWLANALEGAQMLTISSNAAVAGEILQTGGHVAMNNQTGTELSEFIIESGSMTLSNGMDLGMSGKLRLGHVDSRLNIPFLTIAEGTEFNLGAGTLDIDDAFNALDGSTMTFSIHTNHSARLMADWVRLGSNSTLNVDARLADFSAGTHYVTNISTVSGIFVGTETNKATYTSFTNHVALSVDLTLDTNVIGRTRYEGMALPGGDLLVLTFDTQSLQEYWDASGQLATLGDELDQINNREMMLIIDNLGSEASADAVHATYFQTMNTYQTALQGLRASVAQSRSRGTEFRETLMLPTGAKGPAAIRNDWRVWGKYYAVFYSHDESDTPEYDSTLHGGTLGMDRSFGPLLLGFSAGMGRYKNDADNGATDDLNAAHGSLYATWGRDHSYLDAGLAVGFNQVDTETGGPFLLEGEYDSQLISGYFGGGYGFELESIGTILTPEAGVQYSLYQQDAYSEKGITAEPRSFDDFDADSIQTSLGLNAAMLNTSSFTEFGFKVEGRAHWLHEFNADPGDLSFRLSNGDGTGYTLSYPMLDEDAIRLGIGISFFNTKRKSPKNIMFRFDFDEVISEDALSHNLSAKAIFAF